MDSKYLSLNLCFNRLVKKKLINMDFDDEKDAGSDSPKIKIIVYYSKICFLLKKKKKRKKNPSGPMLHKRVTLDAVLSFVLWCAVFGKLFSHEYPRMDTGYDCL